jgi:hypothetical protein
MGAPNLFEKWPVIYLGVKLAIHVNQKPNPSRETVALSLRHISTEKIVEVFVDYYLRKILVQLI